MARSAWMYPQLTSRFFSSSVNLLSLVLIRPRVSGHPPAMTNGLSVEYLVGSVLIIQRAPFFRPAVRSAINALIRSARVCSRDPPDTAEIAVTLRSIPISLIRQRVPISKIVALKRAAESCKPDSFVHLAIVPLASRNQSTITWSDPIPLWLGEMIGVGRQ